MKPGASRASCLDLNASADYAEVAGTNKAELKLWTDAGVDVKQASGSWYLETGSGMGAVARHKFQFREAADAPRGPQSFGLVEGSV